MASPDESLQIARAEFENAQWSSALRNFDAFGIEDLSPNDLQQLAICAGMTGNRELVDSSLETAFEIYRSENDVRQAARCAFWLGFELMRRGEHGRGGGWFGRVSQTLENAPDDCPERGLLLIPAGLQALGQGDPEKAYEIFANAQEIGRRHRDPDLRSLGTLGRCTAEVKIGQVDRAIPALDGLMLDVLTPGVSPLVVGIVYCAAVELCRELFEIARAQEWTNALSSWCDAQDGNAMFRGQCLVYRSELLQFEGAWDEAAEQAALARERLSTPVGDPAVGAAYYQIGELHRLRGQSAEAEVNYRKANDHGHNPEPGMALLSSIEGRHDDALASIRRALGEGQAQEKRIRLLLAAVEIFIDGGEIDEANEALEELNEQHVKSGSPLMQALFHRANAALLVAREEPANALDEARLAEKLITHQSSPYEHARVKVLLGRACELLGDHRTAEIELSSARNTFHQLGAAPDLAKLGTGDAKSVNQAAEHSLTDREVEVTRLVAAGLTNRVIADDLVISEKTVARHLSNIFTKLGIPSRAALTAYAYERGITNPTSSA